MSAPFLLERGAPPDLPEKVASRPVRSTQVKVGCTCDRAGCSEESRQECAYPAVRLTPLLLEPLMCDRPAAATRQPEVADMAALRQQNAEIPGLL
ncbi:hypothetical protein FHX46_000509 [Amycolatopsis viridis]|uniref:Uncharacterized protein n=1 Tax=Amycolatopsis viridis TaxID=185678 RepID=A0ABX0SN39_9PSEU|nr:hypothetical protein [Amycolatopsis viridis]